MLQQPWPLQAEGTTRGKDRTGGAETVPQRKQCTQLDGVSHEKRPGPHLKVFGACTYLSLQANEEGKRGQGTQGQETLGSLENQRLVEGDASGESEIRRGRKGMSRDMKPRGRTDSWS